MRRFLLEDRRDLIVNLVLLYVFGEAHLGIEETLSLEIDRVYARVLARHRQADTFPQDPPDGKEAGRIQIFAR